MQQHVRQIPEILTIMSSYICECEYVVGVLGFSKDYH